jgi:hypothetical protein
MWILEAAGTLHSQLAILNSFAVSNLLGSIFLPGVEK